MMQQKLLEAEDERLEFQNKHDEMFTSVSALNQRIEELESHKLHFRHAHRSDRITDCRNRNENYLHLLSKLKGYGDKGGLEYIVKTQKLD